jgi:hypothetical protein
MTKALIAGYPWDLLDDLDATLDRLRGDVGATGVAVWAAARPVLTLRAREAEPRVFRTRGGLLFHPSPEHLEGTRIKPIVSEWAKGRTVWPRIAEACAARGLELRAIVSAAATGRLAERNPEAASKNLFGTVSERSLCLCNADVQAFVCGLVADLTSREGVAGSVLTDVHVSWDEARRDAVETALPTDGVQQTLLGMCFCESCYQKAAAEEVDAAAARRVAQKILNDSLEHGNGRAERIEVLVGDQPILAAYQRAQTLELSRLVGRLGEACSGELILERSLDGPMRRQHDAIDWSVPAASLTSLNPDTALSTALSAAARRRELRLPASWALGPNAQELVKTVAQAVEAGCDGLLFDHLGLLPDRGLNTVRQALRFARRSGGAPV